MIPIRAERGRSAVAPTPLGEQAVVIGAGIAGLAAAGALADWFERVIVLERDSLPNGAAPRTGTPQAWHAHGLLVGGQLALEELFPNIGDDLGRAGGVRLRLNQDLREELPNGEVMPQRDFGRTAYSMSRAGIEFTVRQRLAPRRNVTFRPNTRVLCILAESRGRRVIGIQCAAANGAGAETLSADLVIDASGRGHLTNSLLQSIGTPIPVDTAVGIDLGYSTVILDIPDTPPTDWRVVFTRAHPSHPASATIMPIERNRWMLTAAGRCGDRPPGTWDGLLDYLQQLSTQTIYNAVRDAVPIGGLTRFGLPDSLWRRFDHIERFPDGLIPIGDAICRFNPIYGQGMSVAAQEAVLLHRLLGARAKFPDPLAGLGDAFLAEASALIETPWLMSAVPDFAFPCTRGERPADLERSLLFTRALTRLAQRDAAVHKLIVDVWHLLTPRHAYRDPALKSRIEAEMATIADAAMVKA